MLCLYIDDSLSIHLIPCNGISACDNYKLAIIATNLIKPKLPDIEELMRGLRLGVAKCNNWEGCFSVLADELTKSCPIWSIRAVRNQMKIWKHFLVLYDFRLFLDLCV